MDQNQSLDRGKIISFLELLPDPIFSSQEAYNRFCRLAPEVWADVVGKQAPGEKFTKAFGDVQSAVEGSFKTSWGGVHVTKHVPPLVEKFLVVSQSRYLAFEKHEEKTETLVGADGIGLLVYRPEASVELVSLLICPGTEITLKPGQEHCLIALSDLLVFEKSTDPKGMDKDLIFIFEPAV